MFLGLAVSNGECLLRESSISKMEADSLSASIMRIPSSEVLQRAVGNHLPAVNDLADANDAYRFKASVLFVDMRGSSRLPERFGADQLVKLYRSYTRAIVQAVRYSGGSVRDFMGDGILAVFLDDEKRTSEERSVHAVRYITTTIDALVNPALDLGRKEQLLLSENHRLAERQEKIEIAAREVASAGREVDASRYRFFRNVLSSAHCKKDYTVAMGQDFWENNYNSLLLAAKEVGKSEKETRYDISFAMVDIYENLGQYDKAYDFLVDQAEGCSWLHAFTVRNIVEKLGCGYRVKSAVDDRLERGDLDEGVTKKFRDIKKWLDGFCGK